MRHPAVIQVRGLSKRYRLGEYGVGTLRESVATLWEKARGVCSNKEHQRKSDFWALRDVSFEVEAGEILGVIGKNGAGKSTLLKILSRITTPTQGIAILQGRVASLLEVGTGFHPELSGRENVFLNGAILGMSKREIASKFDAIIAFSEIGQFIDTPVKRYSSGMYVRLAFAVAAHLDPEILIVDEVLAVGDAAFQAKCLSHVRNAAANGKVVLIVSHNMTAITSLCDRCLLIEDGRVAIDGPTRDVVNRYLGSTHSTESFRRFEADATSPAVIESIELKVNGERPIRLITTGDALDVTMSARVNGSALDINFSLLLYTADGICVLNSISETRTVANSTSATCRIPSNFLNDGSYRLRGLLVKDRSVPLVDIEDALWFDVADIEKREGWHGRWLGVVRPQFQWQWHPSS